MDDKAVIRRRMRLMRELIDDRLLRSVQLWADIASLHEYAAATIVMAFVGANGEPDTGPLFSRLERDGKTLALPRVIDGMIVPALVGDGLVPGYLGVHEPTGPEVPLESIGLVLVPGLAFTASGARLGQGAATTTASWPCTCARRSACASPSNWSTRCPWSLTTSSSTGSWPADVTI